MHSALSYTFVALDLETTGLSQEKDTIIEVAAMKFQLERVGNTFQATNIEERSMLIDPEREIDEHISMITGISNDMVKGKSKWHEVRERVSLFIGDDTIIIGHNVLFDVNMLASHGIDLKNHRTLDTFELSEIFSGDVESLNLGFLAKKYGFDDGSEHRALDDTKLSLKLFLYYLGEVSKLSDSLLSLWQYARTKDESKTIDTLLALMGDSICHESWHHSLLDYSIAQESDTHTSLKGRKYSLKSLSPYWEDEKKIIDSAAKNGKVLILTSSKKQSLWLKEKLSQEYKISYIRERSSYISLRMIQAWLEKTTWKRKETILIIRLIHWLFQTKTGSIDEIKWYGDELSYKFLFLLDEKEETRFSFLDKEIQSEAEILITENYNKDIKNGPLDGSINTCIIRDVGELEGGLRYRESKSIDWALIHQDILHLGFLMGKEKEDLEYALSVLEEIIISVVPRPTGPNVLPPGEYGETYFFTQKDLWHRGYIWLIWAVEKLEQFLLESGSQISNLGIIEATMYARLSKTFTNLITLAKIGNKNSNIILEIKNNRTVLTIIPREQKTEINELLEKQGGETNIFTGYNISTPSIRSFLLSECGFYTDSIENEGIMAKVSERKDNPVILGDKIVILGTNLKHLRTLSAQLKNTYHQYDIFTQGISGGKSKMLHLFLGSKKSILIGLIDTWKDESTLWENTETLSITKIPFDPPNDPTYLARTVGMSNNFELYSIPMAIHTINTLIGRSKSANREINIFLCDEKLSTMNWGKNILRELL